MNLTESGYDEAPLITHCKSATLTAVNSCCVVSDYKYNYNIVRTCESRERG